ncbi:MAG: SusC/RagA family TonB-linked outer membrane protein, partial [Muribaculaceae bacterium]|nr:SusC/RagA family TonB-linked outer membrane protein [Muribaculaceae bacterium]
NKYLYPSVNWMDQMYHKHGYNGRYNVNIRGGAPNAQYYVSLSYYNEKGMTKTDPLQDYSSEITYDRYNFLTNINLKATKTTKLDIGVSGWITGGNYPAESIGTIFGKAMQTNPVIYPVQYPNGENPGISPDNRELDSPWVTLTRRGYQTQNNTQVNTNLKLTQDLGFWNWSKGLEARALVSFDVRANQSIYYRVDDSTWATTATMDPTTGTWADDQYLYDADGNLLLTEKYKGNKTMSVQADKWVYRTFYFEGALNYNRTFEEKHNISALALFTMRNYLDANNSSLFDTLPHKQQSLALRATYDFDRRYFIEFNGGYTGSENFLKGHRFGFFPAVAGGWVPSNESWWKAISPVVSFFKLRYSYGIVGNDSSNGRFTYFAKLDGSGGSFSNYWTRNGANGAWHYSSYGYEPMWSRVHKQDLGIEFNLFGSDLTVVVDLFKEKRDHIFVERTDLPFLAGLEANPYANVGKVKNKGFEISAEYSHRFGQDWLVSLRGNMAYNQDEVIDNAQADPAYPWLDRRGHNVLASWGWIAEGLATSEEMIAERGITQFG